MKKSFYIEEDLQPTFHHLLNRLPEPLRDDVTTQKLILVYLKLGGEKLAHHGIEIIKKRFQIEYPEPVCEAQAAETSLSELVDMTEPHPHELGGFEFPIE